MCDEPIFETQEDETIQVIERRQGSKEFQPDEAGHNLYFTKSESERYNLSPETLINEEYRVKNDRVEWIGRASLNAGFSSSELKEYAEQNDWETIDEYDEDQWSYSFEEPEFGTTISVDNPTIVEGEPLNNVFVRSKEVPIEPDLNGYDHLKAFAKQNGLHVGIRDNLGLWQRLKDSTGIDANDLEVLSQLAKKADIVQAHLKYQYPSVWMNLEQLGALVENINEAIGNYLEVYGEIDESEELITSN